MNVRPVSGKKERTDFLRVPSLLYANDPNYVEQLRLERRQHLGRANPYFQHAVHCLFVAYDAENRPIGRISAQLDRLAQKEGEPTTGHFGLMEAVDAATLQQLLCTAEEWLKGQGVTRVQGPFSLSINDESGLLVHGFDTPPRMLMNYAPAWYGPAVEAAGYVKAKDLRAYRLDSGKPLPDFTRRLAERTLALPQVSERPIKRNDFNAEMAKILAIFNDAWRNNWGFVPMTDAEMRHTAKSLKPIIIPELARIVEVDGAPAGMIVCLPDINEMLDGLKGRLLPFGWLKLLWRLKRQPLTSGRVLLMGVKHDLREKPIGPALAILLIQRLHDVCTALNMKEVELSWILEDNLPVTRVIENVGGIHYKTYRVYEKSL